MQLLWNREWLQVPAYGPAPDCVRIRTQYSRPLLRTQNPSGRIVERRLRKLAIFLAIDGLTPTVLKARSKGAERHYVSDYHSAIVTGATEHGTHVLALVTRVPRCSSVILAHTDLVVPVSGSLSDLAVERIACRFVDCLATPALLDHSYLYRGEAPPRDVAKLLQTVVRDDTPSPKRMTRTSVLAPPESRMAGDMKTVMMRSRCTALAPHPACVLGAGDYARTVVIPTLRDAGAALRCIVDREPQIARFVGERFGFQAIAADAEAGIATLPPKGHVVVATAHDSHARLARIGLEAGHRVFVEKPPVVTHDDLYDLLAAAAAHPGFLDVGFNRRYAPMIRFARQALSRETGPLTMTATVKEVPLGATHWYLWPNQGTRVTGNLCHWIDLGVFFIDDDASPREVSVSPAALGQRREDEERVISATFDDGSLVTIVATGRGDQVRGVQEAIEIRRGDTTIWIDDLRRVRVLRRGVVRTRRSPFRDRGHKRMYRDWVTRSARGEGARYPLWDIARVSVIQLAASTAVTRGVALDPAALLRSIGARALCS